MIIRGIEFPFSTLNADDVDRMLAAQKKQQLRAKEENNKYGTDPEKYPDWLRFQCRIFMDYLDEVLGAGASKQLGLTGRNFNECLTVSQEFADAMTAEKDSVKGFLHPGAAPSAQNRAQRRAEEKARQRTQTAGHIVEVRQTIRSKPEVTVHDDPVESTQHLADAQAAMDTLRNDPEAMQQLADLALKLAADHHD